MAKINKNNRILTTINKGHYLELMDRLHVQCCNIENHILNHPLIEEHKDIERIVETALELLAEAYQRVGMLDEAFKD